jgi:hypothetical protein
MNIENFAEHEALLRANGYHSANVTEMSSYDVDIAKETICPRCGKSCEYVGLRRDDSYLAFAVCRRDNIGEEF